MERDLYRHLWSAAVLAASILIADVAAARGAIAETPNEAAAEANPTAISSSRKKPDSPSSASVIS